MLDGDKLLIKPEGFDQTHQRGGGKHRLNADEHKWEPMGVGSETHPVITVGAPIDVVNGEVL